MPYINRNAKRQAYNTDRQKEAQAIYNNKKWKALRQYKLQCFPICERCKEKGIITAATEVHHIVPFLQFQGQDRINAAYCDLDGLLSLCEKCHTEIHGKKPKQDNNKFIDKIMMITDENDMEQHD